MNLGEIAAVVVGGVWCAAMATLAVEAVRLRKAERLASRGKRGERG
jgi:hypothetical protein